jgi:hypothetical protein
MAAIIYAAGQRLAFRAPYYPFDGPIKFVFNTIQGMLRLQMNQINDEASLTHQLVAAINGIPTFAPYFIHCGFWQT